MASQLEESSFGLVCFNYWLFGTDSFSGEFTLIGLELWILFQCSININQSKKEHIKMLNVQADFALLKGANTFI